MSAAGDALRAGGADVIACTFRSSCISTPRPHLGISFRLYTSYALRFCTCTMQCIRTSSSLSSFSPQERGRNQTASGRPWSGASVPVRRLEALLDVVPCGHDLVLGRTLGRHTARNRLYQPSCHTLGTPRGKGTHLEPHVVVRAKEQGDGVPPDAAPVDRAVHGRLEDVVCIVECITREHGSAGVQMSRMRACPLTRPAGELVAQAVRWVPLRQPPMWECGRGGLLDHKRAGDGRGVNPLLLLVEDLEGLDARFLPENREALQQVRSGTDRASAVRECQWAHLEAV